MKYEESKVKRLVLAVLILGIIFGGWFGYLIVHENGYNKGIGTDSSNIEEFYKDFSKIMSKENSSMAIIYTELPTCRITENMGFIEVNDNGTPKYWIDFKTNT